MRIRKLVPVECMKLMGFTRQDEQAMRNVNMVDSQIYHCAGDSIATTCLINIIGKLLPISDEELKQITNKYIEEIKNG